METRVRNRKRYSISELVLGNLAIIAWIGLGAAVCGLFSPWAALGFFALAAFLVFFEIGKHGCVTCYYCETCTIGMGKLPELFFKPAGTANVNSRAMRLFPFVFALMSVVPIALGVVSILQQLLLYKVALLGALLAFSAYSGVVRRKNLIL